MPASSCSCFLHAPCLLSFIPIWFYPVIECVYMCFLSISLQAHPWEGRSLSMAFKDSAAIFSIASVINQRFLSELCSLIYGHIAIAIIGTSFITKQFINLLLWNQTLLFFLQSPPLILLQQTRSKAFQKLTEDGAVGKCCTCLLP